MRPTTNGQFEIRIRTQQHIPLLLLLLLLVLVISLIPSPWHAQIRLAAPHLAIFSRRSGSPVRVDASLADGRHIARRGARLAVLEFLVRGIWVYGFDGGVLWSGEV